MDRPTKVGFIGRGNMGQPMVARLLEAGFALTVLDADEKAQQAFVDQYGGSPAYFSRKIPCNLIREQ